MRTSVLTAAVIVSMSVPAWGNGFDGDSDVITNQWLGLTNVGDSYALTGYGEFEGATRTFSLTGTETVLGVECLILGIHGHGDDPVTEYYDLRIAEDTDGDLRVLKLTGMDYDGVPASWEATSPEESPVFFPATPAPGQHFDYPWEPGEYAEILATDQVVPQMPTGLGPYSGCALQLWSDGTGDFDYSWHCPNVGVVKEDWGDDGGVYGWYRVPEPTTACLLAIGALVVVNRRRRGTAAARRGSPASAD